MAGPRIQHGLERDQRPVLSLSCEEDEEEERRWVEEAGVNYDDVSGCAFLTQTDSLRVYCSAGTNTGHYCHGCLGCACAGC